MDAFELMGVGRGLCLGSDALRDAYDLRVGEEHPDAGGQGESFAELREAYETLRNPGRRLRHWLELEGVRWEAGGQVPPVMMELFGVVGDLVHRVDGLGSKKAAAKSSLGRSLLEREGMSMVDEVERVRERVSILRNGAVDRFAAFEAAGAESCGEEAVAAARTLLFLDKWDRQLRERWAVLAC